MHQAGHQKAPRDPNGVLSCCPIYVYPMDTRQLTSPQGEAGVRSPVGIQCCRRVVGGGSTLWLEPHNKVAPHYRWSRHAHTHTNGIKHKPISVKNPQLKAILERIHAVLGNMLHTSKPKMAETVKASDIDIFLSDAAWAACSTYHIVLKASPGAAIFRRDMLFDILFIADWQKIGEYRQ